MSLEKFYIKSKRIFVVPFVWTPLAIFVGLFLVSSIEAIVIPLMAFFMYFLASWGTYFLLHIQKANPIILRNKKIFKYFSAFFWGFGLFGALQFLLTGLYLTFAPTEYIENTEGFTNNQFGLYVLQVWFFPLGVSLGSSKSLLKNA